MNVSEANAVDALVRWVCSLTVWETEDGGSPPEERERVAHAARYLTVRSRNVLGAGLDVQDVTRKVDALLELPTG